MDGQLAERIARNEALFRDANEKIRGRAEESGVDERIPFLCECADPTCTEIVRVSAAEYERVRGEPTWFLNALGHNVAAGPASEVVERHPEYEITTKVGRAAEVAEDLDGRRVP